jgi:2-hydroxychromene-2-carboxylate isomerase
VGHDPAPVLAAIDTPSVKDDLRARTDEAIALGIFGVPTWVVDGAHLYWGQDRLRFVEGLPRVSPPARAAAASRAPSLEVYWDFSSPFAYLGAMQVAALAARTGARVTWRPLLLGGLFRALGGPDVPLATFSDAKRRYVGQDLLRWAAYWGTPFRFPSRFPTSSLRAMRVYLALPEEDRGAYREAVFRAYWSLDRDITSDEVLASCVGDAAVAAAALANADREDIKAELRRATEEAAARGVFGVPTFAVGEDLYWGQDRLELVEDALVGAGAVADGLSRA